jgi:class 3 adenylate cyclase/ADP-ribose pyrophosphatase YjhB (NUDIX family)
MKRDILYTMFADIKGFSSLTEKQLEVFVERVFPELASRIDVRELEYVNTWGDGIVLAARSLSRVATVALDMRDYFRNKEWESDALPTLEVRISLHLGECFTGTDPFTQRGLLTGKSVIIAARLEPVTLPGQVWITNMVASALRQQIETKEIRRLSCDLIGPVSLPKNAGVQEVFLLRREHDPPLTEAMRLSIVQPDPTLSRLGMSETAGGPLAPEIVIGIVLWDEKVAVVQRADKSEGLDWTFPSGKKFPSEKGDARVFREVLMETGLTCVVKKQICIVERHPTTNVKAHYYYLEPIDPKEMRNADPGENTQARWLPVSQLASLMDGKIAPCVLEFFAEQGLATRSPTVRHG